MEAVRQTVKANVLESVLDIPASMRGGYVDVFVCPAMASNAAADIPNAQTLSAIDEVQRLKKDPHKKIYNSFADFVQEMAESASSVIARGL